MIFSTKTSRVSRILPSPMQVLSCGDIERIEERRGANPDMDAIYILSPQAHVVDSLMADLDRRRYRKSFLVWTALLDPQLRRRIDSSPTAQRQLGGFETLSVDYFPRESHVVTFRDPWSFPILYHPSCNPIVAAHMQSLATKVCLSSRNVEVATKSWYRLLESA